MPAPGRRRHGRLARWRRVGMGKSKRTSRKRKKKIRRYKALPWRRRKVKHLRRTGKLTAASLRGVMRAGGDLAPMTGVATFGPAGGTVTVTVAVSPATDRKDYGLYASSTSSTPSSS